MKISKFTHKNDNDPYMPSEYIEVVSQTTIDEFEPFDIQKQKRTFNPSIEIDYLFRVRRYVWFSPYSNWYQLQGNGMYIRCTVDDIRSDCYTHIRRHNQDRDVLTRSKFTDILEGLKAISESTIKEEYWQFLAEHPEYERNPESGDLPLIHVWNGYINPDDDLILPECGCKLDAAALSCFQVMYEPLDRLTLENMPIPYDDLGIRPDLTNPECPKNLAEIIPTFEKAYANIIPDAPTREYYFSWLGSMMFDARSENHILILQGRPTTGKSALTVGIGAILGDLVSRQSLVDITGRFGKQPLIGKKLNISNEKTGILGETANTLKDLSDGGIYTIDRKCVPPTDFELYIRFIITCNDLPEFDWNEEGFLKRIKIIYCDQVQNNFLDLHTVFTSEIGKNWLLNRCYLAWKHNKENHTRLDSLVSEAMKRNLQSRKNLDPFYSWVFYHCGTIEGKDIKIIQERFGECTAIELYEEYADFIGKESKPIPCIAFYNRITQRFGMEKVERKSYNIDGKRVSKYYFEPR